MPRLAVLVALALAVPLSAGPGAAAQERPTYRGWVGGFEDQERDRRRAQGAYHALRFRVTPGERVRYRVCLRGGAGKIRRCFSRRTTSAGRSAVNVSLLVNDRGGPGRWQAVWHVNGRRVASWRFRLIAEGV